eukprot:TRINITY_DN12368_c0_g1_i14.p1 TRINITY_DN12368_c0_g1~~TRINITY_DN12368_c0_g1_i14.p1  ORF type:complete len:398 (+),score=74.56 TRINITY_DN12368_c0_g1_i14:1304-2497(+)
MTEEQQALSSRIKSHHAKLRKAWQAGKDADQDGTQTWNRHLTNVAELEQYASAMKSLATHHWHSDEDANSRLNWCRTIVDEYFFKGGKTAAVAKDKRRLHYQQLRAQGLDPSAEPPVKRAKESDQTDTSTDIPVPANVSKTKPHGSAINHELATQTKAVQEAAATPDRDCATAASTGAANASQAAAVPTPPLAVLDVGSCYNAFLDTPDWSVTAVDLAPACDDVHKLDFISVFDVDDEEAITTRHAAIQPGHFDVVIFNLVLSYIPTPQLRYRCCLQACRALRPGGLLIITTPDSKAIHRSGGRMKQWKRAVQSLGTRRWRYEKKPNIHAMAFRKVEKEHHVAEDMYGRMQCKHGMHTVRMQCAFHPLWLTCVFLRDRELADGEAHAMLTIPQDLSE